MGGWQYRNGTCTKCSKGTFGTDGINCQICPQGSYCNDTMLSNHFPCPKGTYNYNVGSKTFSDCKPCKRGSFNPVPGSTSCDFKCSPGTYGNKTGGVKEEIACADCPSGKTSS